MAAKVDRGGRDRTHLRVFEGDTKDIGKHEHGGIFRVVTFGGCDVDIDSVNLLDLALRRSGVLHVASEHAVPRNESSSNIRELQQCSILSSLASCL